MWPPFVSAPMAGYTDSVFREILREFGCPLCYTEMVSAMGMMQGGENSRALLYHLPQDRPLALQLFGKDPQVLAQAYLKVGAGAFDVINVNCGCPAKKVTSTGAGGALLRDPRKMADIVRALKDVSDLPVTVKMRLGWADPKEALDIAFALHEAGADGLVIHGRTVNQGYAGTACWDSIYSVAERVPIPVIGNGDICSPEQGFERMKAGNLGGVMVGRALLGNPFFFSQLRDLLEGRSAVVPGPEDRILWAIRHLDRAVLRYGRRQGVLTMRKHLAFYVKGLRGASSLRVRINSESCPEGVRAILKGALNDYDGAAMI